MAELLLLTHSFSTLTMVGLIWFVQVVHYPLFRLVGPQVFRSYEQCHQRRTTYVVAPLMLVEVTTAFSLVLWRPAGVVDWLPPAGCALLAAVWVSTFFLQVPAHGKLAAAFDAGTHRLLVRSNWFRTAAWTARGVLVCVMCGQAMGLPR